jgi:uncharacterized phage protein (TIGR02218 family)
MVTYNANLIASQQEGFPEFFKFQAGGVIDYLTSWPVSLSFLGQTYIAGPIKRSGFTKDSQFAAVKLTIEAMLTPRFLVYIANHPIEPVTVTIYRAVETTLAQYAVVFKGEVLEIAAKGNHVVANCESGTRKVKTRIPRFICQSFCNHDVFDAKCKANPYTYRLAATIATVSGRTLTSTDLAGYADDYFTMGTIEHAGDYRLITKQTGNTLSLHTAFGADFLAGLSVYLLPGCDGAPDTCKTKFNNWIHFVGMPLISDHNPTVWGVGE